MTTDRDILNAVDSQLEAIRDGAKMVRKLDSFRMVFEKVDRIMAERPVRIVIAAEVPVNLAHAPAFTDGETVWLNGAMMAKQLGDLPLAKVVLNAKSLNLHELCHVIFTPRKDSEMIRWIIDAHSSGTKDGRRIKHAFNILEDQRIEMLFSARYRPAIPYFEQNVLTWMLNKDDVSIGRIHGLVHGRKFIPADIRARAKQGSVNGIGQEATDEMSSIIDKYLHVVFPKDNVQAKRLVEKFATLLGEHPWDAEQEAGSEHGDFMLVEGKPDQKAQKEARERLNEVRPYEPQAEEADEGDEEGDEADQDDAEGAGEAPEAPEDQEDAENDQEGDPQSAGNEKGKPIEDMIRDALNGILQDEDFVADVRKTARAIAEAMEGQDLEPDAERLHAAEMDIPGDVKVIAGTMTRNFRALRMQLEETHARRQTAGRLDSQRYLTRKPWEVDFFKTFDPGHLEETDIELVIMVDQSGSMRQRSVETATALWTIRRSLEPLNARITILGFASTGYLMARPGEKAKPNSMPVYSCHGGTMPLETIRQAYRILENSKRNLRMLLTVTDGAWAGDVPKSHQYVQSLNSMGVLTALVYIGHGTPDAASYRHEHTIFQGASDMSSLVTLSKNIVKTAMQKLLVTMEHS